MPVLSLSPSPSGSKFLALDDPLLKYPRNLSHPFICAPFLTNHHPICIELGKNNCAVSSRVNRLNSLKHCCSYSSGARSEFDHSGQFVVAIDTLESMETTPAPSHPTYDLRGVIKLALAEDSAGRGDVTSMATIPANMEVEAQFLAKEDGIIAGISLAEMVFNEVDPSIKVEWFQKDGDRVHKGLRLGKVYGLAHSIVVAERVALNFMQRMSGIATLTKAMADAAYPAVILETRKTAPGLRLSDKWAVLIGGGKNHRLGLFDMVLIKDNHISIAGGVINALKSSDLYLQNNNLQMEVEIETRTLEEVKEVLEYASKNKTFLTRIMLDNMVIPQPSGDVDVSMLEEAVRMIDGKFETEASGNVTLNTVHRIGQTGVTYISSGALTHSVRALDISLKIDTELALQVGRRTHRA